MHDLYINKLASLERCLLRVNDEFQPKSAFLDSLSRQDAAILNLQRACEVSIDLANMYIKDNNLGLPSNAREAFDILHRHNILSDELASKMKKMIGFRNIAVHEYQSLDINIVVSVIEKHLFDFEEFGRVFKLLTAQ